MSSPAVQRSPHTPVSARPTFTTTTTTSSNVQTALFQGSESPSARNRKRTWETSNSENQENHLPQAETVKKTEKSFTAFLASKDSGEPFRTSAKSGPKPPPVLRGTFGRMPVEERIAYWEKRNTDETQINFLKAAHAAMRAARDASTYVGNGAFSTVYRMPATENAPQLVQKIFMENDSSGNARQGMVSLYQLAEACEAQFRAIRKAHNDNQFPLDVLNLTNIDTWKTDGFLAQPYVEEMFEPTWDAFVKKIDTHGALTTISAEEERLLSTIYEVFEKCMETNLLVDFKPDNLGYIGTGEGKRLVIIDTFGLSGKTTKKVRSLMTACIREFSKENSLLKEYFSQVLPS